MHLKRNTVLGRGPQASSDCRALWYEVSQICALTTSWLKQNHSSKIFCCMQHWRCTCNNTLIIPLLPLLHHCPLHCYYGLTLIAHSLWVENYVILRIVRSITALLLLTIHWRRCHYRLLIYILSLASRLPHSSFSSHSTGGLLSVSSCYLFSSMRILIVD